jgi:hypothetical protein
MGIFLADLYFVKSTGQMVTGSALFWDTSFVNAITALPSRHLFTVIGMRAAMGHVIGLTFVCKEMLCILAFDFGAYFFTRCRFGIASGICFTYLVGFPFIKHANGKCISVTFPCVVCTFGFVIGLARAFFSIAFFTCFDDLPFPKHANR